MRCLYRGFDSLDVSFEACIRPELALALEAAKQRAQELRKPTTLSWKGIELGVLESGARGGYAFVVSTGELGAWWFLKRAQRNDPWGIRASCRSLALAVLGIRGVQSDLKRTIGLFAEPRSVGAVALGRADYAFDFLAPDFELAPRNFVMHSNAVRADRSEVLAEVGVVGCSGRITSVTIGKMPGRQVIVYDKRAEVLARNKVAWWRIWASSKALESGEALAPSDPSASRIWRVEVRAGKTHLRERWQVRGWHDLDARWAEIMSAAISKVRHTTPSTDTNRSRWPDSLLWQRVREEVSLYHSGTLCDVEADAIRRLLKEERDAMLAKQMAGLLTSRAAIGGLTIEELPAFALETGRQMAFDIGKARGRFEQKLAEARRAHDVRFAGRNDPPT